MRVASTTFETFGWLALPLVEIKRKRIDPMLKRTYEAGEDVMRKTRFQWVLLPAVILLILEILSQAENSHDFRCRRNIEPALTNKPIDDTSESGCDMA